MIDPDAPAKPCPERIAPQIQDCVRAVRAVADRKAAVMLIYGAHLLRNGAARILETDDGRGWITHLATNGAGTIHDWEYAWFGASTESVEMNVASGTFGTWHETATNIHLALMAGSLDGLGYGRSLGRFIHEDGVTLPARRGIGRRHRSEPGASADVRPGRLAARDARAIVARGPHRSSTAGSTRRSWPRPFATACRCTVHPGIGYDIISNHPVFSGSAIGRAAEWDFKLFGGSVERLDGGVVLSVGSAIMGPQVFEKSVSCVNNLRLQCGRELVSRPLDLRRRYAGRRRLGLDAGRTAQDEPRLLPALLQKLLADGGAMHYLQCDNAAFIHNLYHELKT